MKRPTQKQFDEAAAGIAFSFAPPIEDCQKCGWPHASGYVCGFCGDDNPTEPSSKKKAKAAP